MQQVTELGGVGSGAQGAQRAATHWPVPGTSGVAGRARHLWGLSSQNPRRRQCFRAHRLRTDKHTTENTSTRPCPS